MTDLATGPFSVMSCALSIIATGERASSLIELRDKLMTTHVGCIYYHFWGAHLHSQFIYPEYHNDFAGWAHSSLHDDTLAERLSVIDPTEYNNLESLRLDLIEVVEYRLEEREIVPWTSREDQFHFIRSKIILFKTPHSILQPEELANIIPILSTSSIFYHFIDARRRTPEQLDDFSTWLSGFGNEYAELIHKIKGIDPYYLSLVELRQELSRIMTAYFKKS